MPRTAVLALAALLCLIPAAWASHIPGQPCSDCASHEYWPTIDGKLEKAGSRSVTFVGTPRSDELLGHHGSDVLRGLGRSDVLWGDHDSTGLSVILNALKDAWARGQALLVAGPLRQATHSLFAISGVASYVTVHPSWSAAIEALDR